MKMKAKHKTCVVAAAAAATGVGVGAGEKMKSVILYPYGPLTGTGCCRMLHAKNLALTSAIYTINMSLLIVLIYSWRINVNMRKVESLEDVYYGVQIAYFAIIGTQMSMIVLSVMLIFGIYKENPGLIVPWIIGYITFMALEAVAMVYSNVLRDHVNKQFDAMCKAEVAFFILRAVINVLAMWGVLRFYNLVRSGITWKGPEAKTTSSAAATTAYHHCNGGSESKQRRLNYIPDVERKPTGCCFFDFDDYDEDDDDEELECGDDDYDYDDYYYDDDDEDSSDCTMLGAISMHQKRQCHRTLRPSHLHVHTHSSRPRNNNIRTVLINKRHHKYKITQPQTRLEVINESERSAGSGSDENDSLLVAYDSTSSLASV
ncbi:uncharacterized protein [Bactrocera oleae]|uniref:uncharacterized protein isoform X2 n=1 Tax=Bactrocera oleae TaxID=104688 RepID=UPI00174A68F6|nr:uncharacterized protein LOC106616276 isoform X2 [Bactrocera oleae]XP_036216345.1 uncharacterized protein LOC106616276 isoform X2 [Bactrocera oleae]